MENLRFCTLYKLLGKHILTTKSFSTFYSYHALTIDAFIGEYPIIYLITISTICHVPKIVSMAGLRNETTQFA